MTVQIPKSQVPDDFADRVEAFRQALLRHRTTRGVAVPTAHHLIEQCVRRVQYPIKDKKPDDFVADFEIVDDTPKTEEPK